MTDPLPISASVHVDAPPDAVWAAVSDPTRMPQWSPECRRVVVLGGGSGVGTRFLGVNRRGWVLWPTVSTVVRHEPGRAIAWRVRQSAATWTYELQPEETGTRLTARRDLAGFSAMTRFGAPLIGGAESHDRELAEGLATTLARIKATVESAVGEQRPVTRGSREASG
ncbi:MAG TPA: SRPBCC family protein [Nocardioidaceae bacterium]|jgi:uncharacterized protein YndB with AHSA1/START domain